MDRKHKSEVKEKEKEIQEKIGEIETFKKEGGKEKEEAFEP